MKKNILGLAFGLIAFLAMAPTSFGATLNLVTDKTQFAIGDEFVVDVKIDSEGVGINASQSTVNFPPEVLQEKSVDKTNSVYSFWLQEPVVDNTSGKVSFIGGSVNGIEGKTLQVIRIVFTVVGSGSANLSFTDGAITAADGNGTNILTTMRGLSVTGITKQEASKITLVPKVPPVQIIKRTPVPTGKLPTAPVLHIPLYPTSGEWYNAVSPFLVRWDLPKDIIDVCAEMNQQPLFDVQTPEGLYDNKTFPALSDGIWYLHIRFKNDVGWGPVTHYQIGIDTAPPLAFQVTSADGVSTYNLAPTVTFSTNDQPSGIRQYNVFVDGNQATSTLFNKYTVPPQLSGKHVVTIVAEDLAGNKTSSKLEITILEKVFLSIGAFALTQFQFFVILFMVLLALIGGWKYSYRLWEKQLDRRIVIAERDVSDTFEIISADAERIINLTKKEKLPAKESSEVGFLAQKIKEKAEKAKRYIIDNIREISEKL